MCGGYGIGSSKDSEALICCSDLKGSAYMMFMIGVACLVCIGEIIARSTELATRPE